MEVLYPRCAGLDVHRDSVVACARLVTAGSVDLEVATFGTVTSALLELSDWLEQRGVTDVAMEATGVYWKPVWHILEGSFQLTLANAAHVKNVPGRKKDVKDAAWLAELHAHGLIRASFVPPTPIQEVRALTRTRKQLVGERSRHLQRLHKTLEDGNVKIGSVVSDLLGVSGRAILTGLIEGESEPERLLERTNGRLKASRHTLLEALRGRVTSHHRFLLKLHLDQIDALDRAIGAVDLQVGKALAPFQDAVSLAVTIRSATRSRRPSFPKSALT
jgi:transposase